MHLQYLKTRIEYRKKKRERGEEQEREERAKKM